MKSKLIEIYAKKKKKKGKEILREGMVSFTIYDKLELRNIPYYIDKDKNVHIGIPGISFLEKQKDGSTKEREIANFYFKSQEEWDDLASNIKEYVLEEFEKEKVSAKEKK